MMSPLKSGSYWVSAQLVCLYAGAVLIRAGQMYQTILALRMGKSDRPEYQHNSTDNAPMKFPQQAIIYG